MSDIADKSHSVEPADSPANRPLNDVGARRLSVMLVLVIVGEMAFLLPFVITRVFRPAVLDVFGLDNTQLGTAFSVYGVLAMVAYLPGGPLADRFGSRGMMCAALLLTSAGGAVLAMIPTAPQLSLLYGFWGITTILLFWAPLIRATRNWGRGIDSGLAFGLLDGGRGLMAAVIASASVAVFASSLPDNVDAASVEQRKAALQHVILIFSAITLAGGALAWLGLPQDIPADLPDQPAFPSGLRTVMRRPAVWMQAVIVLCAYVGYKGLDDLSLYGREGLELDEIQAAGLSTLSMWVRPLAAVAAGLIGDRWSVSRMTIGCFLVIVIGCGTIATGVLQPGMWTAVLLTVIATSAAVYALRGLYYAIMEESEISFSTTGSAVGLVSLVGYTPDVFMGPLMGILLDGNPGRLGHHLVFAVVGGFAFAGAITTLLFRRAVRAERSALSSVPV